MAADLGVARRSQREFDRQHERRRRT
jgi:hypothetical protein